MFQSFVPYSLGGVDFRMRKSTDLATPDELLAEAAQLEALIEAAGERLALVADALRVQRDRPFEMDPRWGMGTWRTAYEQALASFRRPTTPEDFEFQCRLLAGFRET